MLGNFLNIFDGRLQHVTSDSREGIIENTGAELKIPPITAILDPTLFLPIACSFVLFQVFACIVRGYTWKDASIKKHGRLHNVTISFVHATFTGIFGFGTWICCLQHGFDEANPLLVLGLLMEINSAFLHARTISQLSGLSEEYPRIHRYIRHLNFATFIVFRFMVQAWQIWWINSQRFLIHPFYYFAGLYGGIFFATVNVCIFIRLLAADDLLEWAGYYRHRYSNYKHVPDDC
uniref:TLC domain-containing protein n=1 Tax=Ditylenchus dipsaci TaxID=166011 RepID=A0A915CVC1_9BILA